MEKDVAIKEIRMVRRRISARFRHDTKAILHHYQEMEKRYGARMIFLEDHGAERRMGVAESRVEYGMKPKGGTPNAE